MVEIVNVEVTEPVPGVTEVGENEQTAPDGNPDVQASETGLLKAPFCALTVIVKVAGCPAETVWLPEESVREKLPVIGTSLPPLP